MQKGCLDVSKTPIQVQAEHDDEEQSHSYITDHRTEDISKVNPRDLAVSTGHKTSSEDTVALDFKDPLVLDTSAVGRHVSSLDHSPDFQVIHLLELFANGSSPHLPLERARMVPSSLKISWWIKDILAFIRWDCRWIKGFLTKSSASSPIAEQTKLQANPSHALQWVCQSWEGKEMLSNGSQVSAAELATTASDARGLRGKV